MLIEIDCVPLFPTVTLPKFALVGVTLSWGAGTATPEPMSDTLGLLDALLTNEIWPDALPADVGANCAV